MSLELKLETQKSPAGLRDCEAGEESASSREVLGLRSRVAELTASQRLLEEQVRHLHRAKTISDLLGGVAHDLSGTLTGILWCSEALRRRIGTLDPELSVGLADFVGAADYARKLARRLISIGRQREGGFAVISLDEAIGDALSLLDALRPANVRLVSHLTVPDAHIWGNAEELQQVLVNLVTNAFDALPADGGRVSVQLMPAVDTSGEEGRRWACLRVEDTGHGMTPATLGRAFEPFFTTKGVQEGNGLGLVVVQTIVQRHGGTLTASSNVGRGTTMDVMLPLSRSAPPRKRT